MEYILPSATRQRELREANQRNLSRKLSPYARVRILTGDEIIWLCRAHGWRVGAGDGTTPDFSHADLRGINLSGGYGGFTWQTNFSYANLSGAKLVDLWIEDINVHGANLSGADLSNASFTGGDFTEAILRDATLRRMRILTGTFQSADLSGADLTHALFDGTIFTGADLRYADLTDADFTRVNLRDAHLYGAISNDPEIRDMIAQAEP